MNLLTKSSKNSTPVLVLIFIFTSLLSTAQNSGVVVDGKSSKPLMGVNVYSPIIGTLAVTNAEGEFVLKVPVTELDRKVGFSYLGYNNKVIALAEM